MPSKIEVNTIDEFYPVPGRSQSSAKFRSNFASIKNNLKISQKEISDIQGKQIEIQGDALGISGPLGEDSTQPTAIQLKLIPTGVTAGTYSSDHSVLSFTVDSQGRLTAATATTIAGFQTQGVYGAAIDNSNGTGNTATDSRTHSLTVPEFTVNDFGQITQVTQRTLFGFGLQGQRLERGNLALGNANNEFSELPPPSGNFRAGDIWALTWNPLLNPDAALYWSKLPEIRGGTLTAITAGPGISTTGGTTPGVSFNMMGFPELADTVGVDKMDQIVIYDNDSRTCYRTTLESIRSASSTPYSTRLVDDLAPQLGEDLDVRGKSITSSLGGVRIKPQTGSLILNDQTWPAAVWKPEKDSDQQSAQLFTDSSGRLYWRSVGAGSSGISITAGVGLKTSPGTGITSEGSIQMDWRGIAQESMDPVGDFFLAQSSSGVFRRATVGSMMPKYRDFIVVAANGNDSQADGSFTRPFATISKALTAAAQMSNVAYRVVVAVAPGLYYEDINITSGRTAVVSLAGSQTVRIIGTCSVSKNLESTVLQGVTFEFFSQDVDAKLLDVSDGCDSLYVQDCKFFRSSRDGEFAAVNLAGSKRGSVNFVNCFISGTVVNAMISSDDVTLNPKSGAMESVTFTQTHSEAKLGVSFTTKAGTSTQIDGCNIITHVDHQGGVLSLNNVLEIHNSSQSVAVTSTASANRDLLHMQNVSMWSAAARSYSSLNKTGTCSHMLWNVNRKSDLDTINGSPL